MDSIVLPVSVHYQPSGSRYCGAACARMILEYHGRKYTLRTLVKEIGVDKGGITEAKFGLWFLKNGFGVTIQATYRYFPPSLIGLGPEEAEHEVREWCRCRANCSDPDERGFAVGFLDFFAAGGVFEPGPVTFEDLRESLISKVPPILVIDVAPLIGASHWFDPHSVVVRAAHGSDRITVNDPAARWDGVRTYDRDQLMHACHSLHGCGIFISPKDSGK